MFSTLPQCGQIGPRGQRTDSRYSRAFTGSVNMGFVRSAVMVFAPSEAIVCLFVCYVKYISPTTNGVIQVSSNDCSWTSHGIMDSAPPQSEARSNASGL